LDFTHHALHGVEFIAVFNGHVFGQAQHARGAIVVVRHLHHQREARVAVRVAPAMVLVAKVTWPLVWPTTAWY
jgi:hypothetical protein